MWARFVENFGFRLGIKSLLSVRKTTDIYTFGHGPEKWFRFSGI
jgi:hypothetical protein